MFDVEGFDTFVHKYWAFWKAKKDIYQWIDVLLLFFTGGFWAGWLIGEMLLVAQGSRENEGTRLETHAD